MRETMITSSDLITPQKATLQQRKEGQDPQLGYPQLKKVKRKPKD